MICPSFQIRVFNFKSEWAEQVTPLKDAFDGRQFYFYHGLIFGIVVGLKVEGHAGQDNLARVHNEWGNFVAVSLKNNFQIVHIHTFY